MQFTAQNVHILVSVGGANQKKLNQNKATLSAAEV